MARRLGADAGDSFKELCQNLLESSLKENYIAAKMPLKYSSMKVVTGNF